MTTSHPTSTQVLVVGAGPAGLTTAVALARRGVETLLVERRAELSSLPRATTVSLRSMEILRAWGLEDDVLAGGAAGVDWTQWNCSTLAEVENGYPTPTGLPTRAASEHLSPSAPGCIPQDHLERVLLAHLRALPAARVELGVEAALVENGDDGVRVALRGAAGTVREVEPDYLVAADGAFSAIRARLGIAMRGPDGIFEAFSALFRAPLWDLVGEHRHGLYWVDRPDGPGLLLPAGPDDRWVMGALLEPGTFEPAAFTDEALVARVRALAGVPDLPVELERTGRFTCGAQVAERFRQGSAFLVGDAAHRATPRGGTGMNTGIQDGYDLGWKLHWVLAGWADEALLDTYETERRPVAQHNVERSLVAGIGQDLHADLGGRLTHVWLEDGRSSLDLAGEGLTLVTASPERVAVPATGWVPLELEVVDPIAARALGIPRDGALLVRPDATPVATLPARVAEPALAA